MIIVSTAISETKAKVHAVYTDDTSFTSVSIETLPVAENQLGKVPELYINPVTGQLFYEYMDKPLTEGEQVLLQRISDLETLALELGGVI